MSGLHKILAIFFLTVWASCTIHCEVENLACSNEFSCFNKADNSGQEPSGKTHCVCSAIESGGYLLQKNAFLGFLAQNLLLAFIVSPQNEDAVPQPELHKLIFSPPELAKTWQFSFRAALPPRAPSLVS